MDSEYSVSKQHKTTLIDVLKAVLILGGPAIFVIVWFLLERYL